MESIKHRCSFPPGNCMTWQVCCLCGETLSLGPSNDSPPEVKLERKLARILAEAHRINDSDDTRGAACDYVVRRFIARLDPQ